MVIGDKLFVGDRLGHHHHQPTLLDGGSPPIIKTQQHPPNIVKQLVIRSRWSSIFPIEKSSSSSPPLLIVDNHHKSLDVFFWLKVAIPLHLLNPQLNNPRHVSIPLMSDHNLRLNQSFVLPLLRSSPNSKPAIHPTCSNSIQANRAASILNLSKSFRHHAQKILLPNPTISIRNFEISLIFSNLDVSFLPSNSEFIEYVVVLECLSLWNSIGPHWPNSTIIPTPTCLRNSFRLILTPQNLVTNSKFHIMTFPTLRRDRSSQRFNTITITPSKSAPPTLLDQESKSLTDESEPDCSVWSEDDDGISKPSSHWTQDVLSNTFEGVFPSTNQLVLSILHHDLHGPWSQNPTITAQRIETHLSISLDRPRQSCQDSSLTSISLSIHLHALLHHFTLKTHLDKIPLVFHLPDYLATQIISSQWSCITGDSVLESLVPFHNSSQPPPPSTLKESDPLDSPSSSRFTPTLLSNTSSLPDLELLNTPSPFEDSSSTSFLGNVSWGDLLDEADDVEASFEGFSTPTAPKSLPTHNQLPEPSCSPTSHELLAAGDIRGRFTVWFNMESLLRQVASPATSQDKQLLKFNLRGQIELALDDQLVDFNHQQLALPLFAFPNVAQQICSVVVTSGDHQSLTSPNSQLIVHDHIKFPKGALKVNQKGDKSQFKIMMNVRTAGPDLSSDDLLILSLSNLWSHHQPNTPLLETKKSLEPIDSSFDLGSPIVELGKNQPVASSTTTAKISSSKRQDLVRIEKSKRQAAASSSIRKRSYTLSDYSLLPHVKVNDPTPLVQEAKNQQELGGAATPEPLRILAATIDVGPSFQEVVSTTVSQFLDITIKFARPSTGELALAFLSGVLQVELVEASEHAVICGGKRVVRLEIKAGVREARVILKIFSNIQDISQKTERGLVGVNKHVVLPSFSCSVGVLDLRLELEKKPSSKKSSRLLLPSKPCSINSFTKFNHITTGIVAFRQYAVPAHATFDTMSLVNDKKEEEEEERAETEESFIRTQRWAALSLMSWSRKKRSMMGWGILWSIWVLMFQLFKVVDKIDQVGSSLKNYHLPRHHHRNKATTLFNHGLHSDESKSLNWTEFIWIFNEEGKGIQYEVFNDDDDNPEEEQMEKLMMMTRRRWLKKKTVFLICDPRPLLSFKTKVDSLNDDNTDYIHCSMVGRRRKNNDDAHDDYNPREMIRFLNQTINGGLKKYYIIDHHHHNPRHHDHDHEHHVVVVDVVIAEKFMMGSSLLDWFERMKRARSRLSLLSKLNRNGNQKKCRINKNVDDVDVGRIDHLLKQRELGHDEKQEEEGKGGGLGDSGDLFDDYSFCNYNHDNNNNNNNNDNNHKGKRDDHNNNNNNNNNNVNDDDDITVDRDELLKFWEKIWLVVWTGFKGFKMKWW